VTQENEQKTQIERPKPFVFYPGVYLKSINNNTTNEDDVKGIKTNHLSLKKHHKTHHIIIKTHHIIIKTHHNIIKTHHDIINKTYVQLR